MSMQDDVTLDMMSVMISREVRANMTEQVRALAASKKSPSKYPQSEGTLAQIDAAARLNAVIRATELNSVSARPREFWGVSPWLADMLASIGERVEKIDYHHVWARAAEQNPFNRWPLEYDPALGTIYPLWAEKKVG